MKSSSFSSHLSSKTSDGEEKSTKGTNPLYEALRERRGSFRPQPKNTILYEVQKSDTLAGIAARFNTTPSELVILNKLGCRTIFPSQIIYVPDLSVSLLHDIPSPTGNVESSFNGRLSPKPGHVQRIKALEEVKLMDKDSHKSPSQIAEDLNKESLSKFLKINAKHITDGEGVVSGVLLVTPNHLMFDPNVSDLLVIEHGVEKYGVAAPIHMVVRCALYTDIVRMRIKGSDQLRSDDNSLKIYHSPVANMKKSHSQDDALFLGQRTSSRHVSQFKQVTVPESSVPKTLKKKLSRISEMSIDHPEEASTNNIATSSGETVALNDPCNSEDVPDVPAVKTLAQIEAALPEIEVPLKTQERQPSSEEDDSESILTSSGEHSVPKKTAFERTKNKLQKSLLKLPLPEGIFSSSSNHRRMSLPISASFQELKSKVTNPVNHKKKAKDDPHKVEVSSTSYVNMVEEKPELFTPLDKLIPRPAKSFDDTPLYLCLRMGRPVCSALKRRISPVINFGCKLKQEYWFSIPKARVDSLYWFLMRWAPDRYGEVYDINFDELGFIPIDDEEEEFESIPVPPTGRQRSASWAFPWRRKKSIDVCEKDQDRSPSWEFLSREEVEQENLTPSEVSLPEMLNPSDILTEDHILKLTEHLPPRAVGYAWSLIYSTSVHGFSLKTLYREMVNFSTPVLIVVQSDSGAVFGAVLSSPLKLSDHFYGTGESFLYTFFPEFKCFKWSGENPYFIKGNTGSFAVGASDGRFGLWLDDDLFHGCTKECRTFANDVLCDEEDFIVKGLEAWGFV